MRRWLLLVMVCGVGVFACGNDTAPDPVGPGNDRARLCPPAQSAERIPQRLAATAQVAKSSFEQLRLGVASACAGCHLAPANTGGFTYQNAYRGSEVLVDGQRHYVPGLSEVAAKMATSVLALKMPPEEQRASDPAGFLRLGRRLQAWNAAELPESGDFPIPGETVSEGQQLPAAIAAAMTDLGDCVPAAEIVGHDAKLDEFFAAATELPERLDETDLVSLDAYVLAKRGTVAFDVEYPLWADNAHKGRWVHVPSAVENGVATRRSITLDPATGRFQIPDNTRFYKTFFKQVKEEDGEIRYRKVETRLIVVRHAPSKPLFGTYLWDDTERGATLHTLPYRSGEPFKDLQLLLETDAATHATRTYAVPGAHRCTECHQGSESDSFILGFTPLQVNRRAIGEAGRTAPTEADELSQLARLNSYGVVAGVAPETAPKLEATGRTGVQPRNIHELRVQAYTTGNCGHCHNPKGFATQQNSALTMNLLPGGNVFQFPTSFSSIYPQGGVYIKPGTPAQSLIYMRMAEPTQLQGSIPLMHMPLHTPGIDCEAVTHFGKWITSIPATGSAATPAEIAEALAKAEAFVSTCKTPENIDWLEEDFTEPPVYVPRRADWNDPVNGMPESVRALEFTPALQQLANTPIANGYWIRKPNCQFPPVAAPPDGTRPWMLNPDGTPKRPFGEIYYQTPGAAYFTAVCQKCHGQHADAETGIAKTILFATGGLTRVANLRDGFFGHGGANLAHFDVVEPSGPRNLAGNYLIWMASGGTRAYFPPELEPIVGPNGGNMLNLVRQTCGQLLPGHPNQLLTSFQIYETYEKICAFENPISPELGFEPGTTVPLDAALQAAWLDRAARNAGWMIYRFLTTDGASGHWPLTPFQCEVQFSAPAAPPSGP